VHGVHSMSHLLSGYGNRRLGNEYNDKINKIRWQKKQNCSKIDPKM